MFTSIDVKFYVISVFICLFWGTFSLKKCFVPQGFFKWKLSTLGFGFAALAMFLGSSSAISSSRNVWNVPPVCTAFTKKRVLVPRTPRLPFLFLVIILHYFRLFADLFFPQIFSKKLIYEQNLNSNSLLSNWKSGFRLLHNIYPNCTAHKATNYCRQYLTL